MTRIHPLGEGGGGATTGGRGAGQRLRVIFEWQVRHLERGDLDRMVLQYHHDAVLLRFDRVARGRAEIRAMLADYLRLHPRVVELDALVTADDTLSYRATMMLGDQTVRALGTIVIRDGKIWRQTSDVIPD